MNRNPPLHEFIALVALLFSTAAFSIDAMLPSFPEISADLELANANHAQLVIVVFVLGISFGQLVMGPLSDSFGRKLIICTGLGMFLCACLWAYVADSLLSLLAARFVQGLGVAAPRTATQAMVRDRYSGREMAKVLSFAMMLFVLVPAVAPLIGQTIMLAFGWRFIFVSFQILALVAALWLIIRQPETHAPERRSAFRPRVILAALVEVLSNRRVLACTLSLSLGFACIFSYLMLAQQCYVDWLGAGEDFPLYFGLVALVSGSASFLNAMLVTRLGMWSLSTAGYCAIFLLSTVTALLIMWDAVSASWLLWTFVAWSSCVFFLLGLCLANMNALALEPMGHIAGMASAIIGSISTLLCVLFALPIGLSFDGTGLPLVLGVSICSGLAVLVNLSLRRRTQPGQ